MRFGRRCLRSSVGVACAVVLAAGVATPMNATAQETAPTSAQVREQAAAQNARLEELVSQLDAGRAEVEGLDQQISELAQQSIAVQGSLIEDRTQLRKMVETSYRWGGMPSLWDIALSSDTLDEFISRIYYANKVTAWQTGCVTQLNDDKRVLDEHMNQIESVRNERRAALEDLENTCNEVSASVDALLKQAASLEAKERAAEEARLATIARQAQAEQKRTQQQRAQEQAEGQARQLAKTAATDAESLQEHAAQDDAIALEAKTQAQVIEGPVAAAALQVSSTAMELEAVEAAPKLDDAAQPEAATQVESTSETEPTPVPEVEPQPEPQPEPEQDYESTEGAGEWIECVASAYTIADNTPPGSTATASGIPLDESVPTVAMPVSMNPSRFYGSMIQIEYEGMTVIATVTDCGGMGGGSRGLDLTPAVFRAFGVETGDDWGLRTVRYRFL